MNKFFKKLLRVRKPQQNLSLRLLHVKHPLHAHACKRVRVSNPLMKPNFFRTQSRFASQVPQSAPKLAGPKVGARNTGPSAVAKVLILGIGGGGVAAIGLNLYLINEVCKQDSALNEASFKQFFTDHHVPRYSLIRQDLQAWNQITHIGDLFGARGQGSFKDSNGMFRITDRAQSSAILETLRVNYDPIVKNANVGSDIDLRVIYVNMQDGLVPYLDMEYGLRYGSELSAIRDLFKRLTQYANENNDVQVLLVMDNIERMYKSNQKHILRQISKLGKLYNNNTGRIRIQTINSDVGIRQRAHD